MQRKFLEDLKLDKEIIDKILDENSADIGRTKKSYANVKNDLDEAMKQLNAANDSIEQLKAEHQSEINGIKIDSAIRKVLSDHKAQYPELLAEKFDRQKIQIAEDGQAVGLEEQFHTIKSSYRDMFGVQIAGKTPINPEGQLKGNTFESLINSADNMTAEEVAEQFAAMQKE